MKLEFVNFVQPVVLLFTYYFLFVLIKTSSVFKNNNLLLIPHIFINVIKFFSNRNKRDYSLRTYLLTVFFLFTGLYIVDINLIGNNLVKVNHIEQSLLMIIVSFLYSSIQISYNELRSFGLYVQNIFTLSFMIIFIFILNKTLWIDSLYLDFVIKVLSLLFSMKLFSLWEISSNVPGRDLVNFLYKFSISLIIFMGLIVDQGMFLSEYLFLIFTFFIISYFVIDSFYYKRKVILKDRELFKSISQIDIYLFWFIVSFRVMVWII